MKVYYVLPKILQYFLYIFCKVLFSFFLRLEVKGAEYLPSYKGLYIITPNHQSELDALIVLTIFYKILKKKPLYYVSREKNFYDSSGWRGHLYGGKLFQFLGAYPVYPGKGDYRISLKHHIELLQKGYSICIFPEGKRSLTGELNRAKGGALFLAQMTNAQIMPVAIKGITNLSIKDFFLRKRRVSLHIDIPVDVSKLLTKHDPYDFEYYNLNAAVITTRLQKLL